MIEVSLLLYIDVRKVYLATKLIFKLVTFSKYWELTDLPKGFQNGELLEFLNHRPEQGLGGGVCIFTFFPSTVVVSVVMSV